MTTFFEPKISIMDWLKIFLTVLGFCLFLFILFMPLPADVVHSLFPQFANNIDSISIIDSERSQVKADSGTYTVLSHPSILKDSRARIKSDEGKKELCLSDSLSEAERCYVIQ